MSSEGLNKLFKLVITNTTLKYIKVSMDKLKISRLFKNSDIIETDNFKGEFSNVR